MPVQRIMKDLLQKKKVCVWWVPHCLNADQCEQSVMTVKQLPDWYKVEGKAFLKRIVATDETWIRDFEPKLKS